MSAREGGADHVPATYSIRRNRGYADAVAWNFHRPRGSALESIERAAVGAAGEPVGGHRNHP